MKAICIHRFGGPEVMVREELQTPAANDGEIVVRVEAAGVNPVDYKIREGHYLPVPASRLPIVLGRDLCGTVVANDGHDTVGKGDAVYAFLGIDRGSYAEYAVLRPGEYARRPRGLDAATAASVPLAALTAWQGLFDHGRLRAGERVLIHGGAGGVGHFAIQFAKAHGAEVITTASAGDLEFVRALGADRALDYKAQPFEQQLRDVDLVFDLIGGDMQARSWQVLKPAGARLISTLTEPSQDEAGRHHARGARYTAQPDAAQLERITQLIEDGKVRPHLDRTFRLEDAADAHRHLQGAHVRGKLALAMHAA